MAFTKRYIVVTFAGQGGGGSYKIEKGHRVWARINQPGPPDQAKLELAVYGMPLSVMNELTLVATRWRPVFDYKVIVEAGDDENGMSTIFIGDPTSAWADMRAMPNCPFRVTANAGGVGAVQNDVKPTSHKGPTDVPKMVEKLAKDMKLIFRNHGVNAKIADPYFPGAPRQQVLEICGAVPCGWTIEKGVLSIFPWDKPGPGGLMVSRQTGMVGYPILTYLGVEVKIEFKRAIDYWSVMTIQSDIDKANGQWTINTIDYDLQSETPKGHWFVTLGGIKAGEEGFVR